MATYTLNSIIKIGRFKPFRGVNGVTIKKSLGLHLDTAIVTLPTTARVKSTTEATRSVDTAREFKRGDRIAIDLGYNGELRREFEGFIARVNMKSPCELECEGYGFQLRGKTVNRLFQNSSMEEVLAYIIEGTDIVLGEVDDIPFSNIHFVKESGLKCLELLKKYCGNVVNIWFDGNIIHAGYKYTFYTERNKAGKADVKYRIGYNTVEDKDMKQREIGDNQVEVEFYNRSLDGNRITATAGVPNSRHQQKKLQAISDLLALRKAAQNSESYQNYSGFEGKIVTFLSPYCQPGYKMEIQDDRYPERSGNYLVEAVTTNYGTGGASREIEISFKL